MKLLTQKDWREIVVNGDLLDNGHFKRYSKANWEVLKTIRKLSKNIPVRLVEGNHDADARVLCEILGLDFVQEHVVETDDKRILFMHGHQFDGFIKKNPKITLFASNIYYLIQLMDKNSKITGWIKRTSKSWLNASKIVADRAIKHATDRGFTDVVCGHVHQAEKRIIPWGDANYWNTGTFCDSPSHYFILDKDGNTCLNSV